MTTTLPRTADPRAPVLPPARGEISAAFAGRLRGRPGALPGPREVAAADPYGEDVQLALHLCYELHYRGFDGVPDDAEWDPELLRGRALLEERFEEALRDGCPGARTPAEVFDALLTEPPDGRGVSRHLLRDGTLTHLREHAVLRSVHQLRESDPQAWVLPRLGGRAKAAMATVLYDEFGAGRPERVHAGLYADLMDALGLDPRYGHYLPVIGAAALAPTNLMSLLGLRRAHRGALVGHFAVLETTSPPAASWHAAALRRCGVGEAAVRYYDEHVEADAVHEQLVRHEVVGGLLADEPELAADVVFGAEATVLLEDALGEAVVSAWEQGSSALLAPVEEES
ncbi:iron-containing redox enzyme family protein [Streptomyces filamentosus]|uniref:iron-containing redox enzyme family protein n=1 Tax=Streptomyces filamentosus TaxID=67294 RepID=UPI00123962CF|nr:iron-containing redox enzyme family protein [Streptomyces filamentosus]KAA6210942.1 iron-containing redox enzyme family protein [Streptomyces filamentosus]